MVAKTGVILFAIVFFTSQVHARITGDTINATYYFPDSTTPYSPYGSVPNAIVGSGVEFSAASSPYPFSYFDIDLSDDSVKITFLTDAPYSGGGQSWESGITFNGLKLTNLSKSFDPSTLTSGSLHDFNWTGETISLNWQGITFRAGDQIVITSVTSPVPEPEIYAQFLIGLGVLGLMLHNRKLAANTRVSRQA